jgi:hypothetical protein
MNIGNFEFLRRHFAPYTLVQKIQARSHPTLPAAISDATPRPKKTTKSFLHSLSNIEIPKIAVAHDDHVPQNGHTKQ